MPELPEVETVARQLSPLVAGRRVRRLEIIDSARLAPERPGRLRGREILTVRRLGKLVLLEAGPAPSGRGAAQLFVTVHLRMTGRLIFHGDGGAVDERHLRARFWLDGAGSPSALLFYDTRRFGVIELSDNLADIAPDGIDPLSDALDEARFAALVSASDQSLKAFLMRQDRLVGVGNIYASEILARARLSPQRRTRSLDAAETRRLRQCVREILERAIEACGTTFSDFQDAYGLTGSYQRYLAVYGREGQRCRRRGCQGTIVRLVQQQRSTFYCPHCQA